MLKAIPAQDFRIRLGEYLDRCDLSGDSFVVTRGDRAKAVVLGATQYLELMERLEALEAGQPVPPRSAEASGEKVLTKEKLKTMVR
ncbi:MAG: type II toxin-antitoxin system Phd/YefM family antitoxin [Acidobacteriia bacterium]|nr:type II toxin-antitoxin system Phd/YefM family antitoxin [Terriglobia bacterium]